MQADGRDPSHSPNGRAPFGPRRDAPARLGGGSPWPLVRSRPRRRSLGALRGRTRGRGGEGAERRVFWSVVTVLALLIVAAVGGSTGPLDPARVPPAPAATHPSGIANSSGRVEPGLSVPRPLGPASLSGSAALSGRTPDTTIDPYSFHLAEPAPMGMTDFGVTAPGQGYAYATPAVRGVVAFQSAVEVSNASLGSLSPWFGSQLNTMLVFDDRAGTQFTYWVQDVALYNTSSGEIGYFLDNIWNNTVSGAEMSNSSVSGAGSVASATGPYYYFASSSFPGAVDSPLGTGGTLTLEMNASETSDGAASVSFCYDDGHGWVVYDTVVFPWATGLDRFDGFVVDGDTLDPIGSPYDLELTFGGPGGGADTTDLESNLSYYLTYFNGHNFQSPISAFNFGDETAEGSSAVHVGAYANPAGDIYARLVPSSGDDGVVAHLYNLSIVSVLNFNDPGANGVLLVDGNATPFQDGSATLVLRADTYDVSVDINGQTTSLGDCQIAAGEQLNVSLSAPCTGAVSSSSGPGGSGGLFLLVLIVVVVAAVAIGVAAVLLRRRRTVPVNPYPPAGATAPPTWGAPPPGYGAPASAAYATAPPPVPASPAPVATGPPPALAPAAGPTSAPPSFPCPHCGRVRRWGPNACPWCGSP